MVSGTPLKRSRQDENENTPLRTRRSKASRDIFRTPLTPCQPTQPFVATPNVFLSAPLTPDNFHSHTPLRARQRTGISSTPSLTQEDIERMREAHRAQEREHAERVVEQEQAGKTAKVEEVLKTMRRLQVL